MARSVICFGVFALGLAVAVPAAADNQHHGYVAVSKILIDPGMTMLNDGPDPQQQRGMPNVAPREPGAAAGLPLDQMGGEEGDMDAPAGDDPMSDNAVETDTVYTA